MQQACGSLHNIHEGIYPPILETVIKPQNGTLDDYSDIPIMYEVLNDRMFNSYNKFKPLKIIESIDTNVDSTRSIYNQIDEFVNVEVTLVQTENYFKNDTKTKKSKLNDLSTINYDYGGIFVEKGCNAVSMEDMLQYSTEQIFNPNEETPCLDHKISYIQNSCSEAEKDSSTILEKGLFIKDICSSFAESDNSRTIGTTLGNDAKISVCSPILNRTLAENELNITEDGVKNIVYSSNYYDGDNCKFNRVKIYHCFVRLKKLSSRAINFHCRRNEFTLSKGVEEMSTIPPENNNEVLPSMELPLNVIEAKTSIEITTLNKENEPHEDRVSELCAVENVYYNYLDYFDDEDDVEMINHQELQVDKQKNNSNVFVLTGIDGNDAVSNGSDLSVRESIVIEFLKAPSESQKYFSRIDSSPETTSRNDRKTEESSALSIVTITEENNSSMANSNTAENIYSYNTINASIEDHEMLSKNNPNKVSTFVETLKVNKSHVSNEGLDCNKFAFKSDCDILSISSEERNDVSKSKNVKNNEIIIIPNVNCRNNRINNSHIESSTPVKEIFPKNGVEFLQGCFFKEGSTSENKLTQGRKVKKSLLNDKGESDKSYFPSKVSSQKKSKIKKNETIKLSTRKNPKSKIPNQTIEKSNDYHPHYPIFQKLSKVQKTSAKVKLNSPTILVQKTLNPEINVEQPIDESENLPNSKVSSEMMTEGEKIPNEISSEWKEESYIKKIFLAKDCSKDIEINKCVLNWNIKYPWMTYNEKKFACKFCKDSHQIFKLENMSQIYFVSAQLCKHESKHSHKLSVMSANIDLQKVIVKFISDKPNILVLSSNDSFYKSLISYIENITKFKMTENELKSLLQDVAWKFQVFAYNNIENAIKAGLSCIIDECRRILVVRTFNMQEQPFELLVPLGDYCPVDEITKKYPLDIVYCKYVQCGNCQTCLKNPKIFDLETLPVRYPSMSSFIAFLENDLAVIRYINFLKAISSQYQKAHWTDAAVVTNIKTFFSEEFKQFLYIETVLQLIYFVGQIVFKRKWSLPDLPIINTLTSKLKGILSDVSVSYIHFFLQELSHTCYLAGAHNLKDFDCIFKLPLLINIHNDGNLSKAFCKIFAIIKNHLPVKSPKIMIDHLFRFGQYITNQMPLFNFKLYHILQKFHIDEAFRQTFRLVHEFYKVVALLPCFGAYWEISLANTSACANIILKNIKRPLANQILHIMNADYSVIHQFFEESNSALQHLTTT